MGPQLFRSRRNEVFADRTWSCEHDIDRKLAYLPRGRLGWTRAFWKVAMGCFGGAPPIVGFPVNDDAARAFQVLRPEKFDGMRRVNAKAQ